MIPDDTPYIICYPLTAADSPLFHLLSAADSKITPTTSVLVVLLKPDRSRQLTMSSIECVILLHWASKCPYIGLNFIKK